MVEGALSNLKPAALNLGDARTGPTARRYDSESALPGYPFELLGSTSQQVL